MPFIETSDHTSLYYRDWGTGKPVIFVSSWALGGEMWEYQMIHLSSRGLRCIACDRRGHGRSDDPGHGYDFDTLADDLAALIETLDLREVTLVGHSMGCADIARYLSRHGSSRISSAVLISPIRLVRAENDREDLFEMARNHAVARMSTDRPLYFAEGTIKFFGLGSKWPGPPDISAEMLEWANGLTRQTSPKAMIDFFRAMLDTDFTPDIRAFTMPTLIIHGDNDQSAPLEMCGRRITQAIPGSQFKIYERAPHGLFLTEKDHLNRDLLEFIRDE
jgi:non-heme chloroperoxidase